MGGDWFYIQTVLFNLIVSILPQTNNRFKRKASGETTQNKTKAVRKKASSKTREGICRHNPYCDRIHTYLLRLANYRHTQCQYFVERFLYAFPTRFYTWLTFGSIFAEFYFYILYIAATLNQRHCCSSIWPKLYKYNYRRAPHTSTLVSVRTHQDDMTCVKQNERR